MKYTGTNGILVDNNTQEITASLDANSTIVQIESVITNQSNVLTQVAEKIGEHTVDIVGLEGSVNALQANLSAFKSNLPFTFVAGTHMFQRISARLLRLTILIKDLPALPAGTIWANGMVINLSTKDATTTYTGQNYTIGASEVGVVKRGTNTYFFATFSSVLDNQTVPTSIRFDIVPDEDIPSSTLECIGGYIQGIVAGTATNTTITASDTILKPTYTATTNTWDLPANIPTTTAVLANPDEYVVATYMNTDTPAVKVTKWSKLDASSNIAMKLNKDLSNAPFTTTALVATPDSYMVQTYMGTETPTPVQHTNWVKFTPSDLPNVPAPSTTAISPATADRYVVSTYQAPTDTKPTIVYAKEKSWVLFETEADWTYNKTSPVTQDTNKWFRNSSTRMTSGTWKVVFSRTFKNDASELTMLFDLDSTINSYPSIATPPQDHTKWIPATSFPLFWKLDYETNQKEKMYIRGEEAYISGRPDYESDRIKFKIYKQQ